VHNFFVRSGCSGATICCDTCQFYQPNIKEASPLLPEQMFASISTYHTVETNMLFMIMKGSVKTTVKYNQLCSVCDGTVFLCKYVTVKGIRLQFDLFK
jgi:hypothetical protein